MKYKTKIVENDGSYVGYAYSNNDVVYTTNTHSDPVMVTRELSVFISSSQSTQPTVPTNNVRSLNPVNATTNTNAAVAIRNRIAMTPVLTHEASTSTASQPTVVMDPVPPRRCCGRG